IAQRNTALNITAQRRSREYLHGVWSDDLAGGLRALVQGTLVDRIGARDSVATGSATSRHAKVAAFANELEQAGLMENATSGAYDLETRKVAAALDNGEDVSKFSKTARSLADIYMRHQELLRQDLNIAGAWIGKLKGFIATQSHDMWKIAKAGGAKIGEEAN